MTSSFTPRPSQREILQYTSGRLGISAVPGSGKTHTLSALAAKIVSSGRLEAGQEVLIVTLVNSAVDNFTARIAESVMIPQIGYRVRTLHGFAHDIVREDPPLVGLDKKFTIVDELASNSILHETADAWLRAHPDFLDPWISPGLDDYQRSKVFKKGLPELVELIAVSFMRSAKDNQLTPERLRLALQRQPSPLPLAQMGLELYSDYQQALAYRGAVDFDDLIRLACDMLEASPELLERLRYRWPFILEDEAQDSSAMQQCIISLLVGDGGNWVRVGDPNQAIFETFTTADPKLLRDFIRSNPSKDMPESGRCQPSIMALANALIRWVMSQHPVPAARDSLTLPLIAPAPAGDPQQNPADDPSGIHFVASRLTPEEEVDQVVSSLESWLPDHKDSTVAILTSTNDHAARVVEELKRKGIEYRELLRSTAPTRAAAGSLSHVLSYLAEPGSPARLAQAYRVWRRDWREGDEHLALLDRAVRAIRKQKQVEEFIYPRVPVPPQARAQSNDPPGSAAGTILDAANLEADPAETEAELSQFKEIVRRWHGATVLPIDQLVLTVSQEIFSSPADLALAHKLAIVLRQIAGVNPAWRLPELIPSLHEIARNERRFIGFSSDDGGFNPGDYPGVVVVSTMHKAKGLEWDRVYLMALNNYDYPSDQPGDTFIAEKWFLRDRLNLEEEALAQLEAANSAGEYEYYEEGSATRRARLDYVRERLRLLYVGITRARRELFLSWNTGRGEATPSLAFAALRGWWEAQSRTNGS